MAHEVHKVRRVHRVHGVGIALLVLVAFAVPGSRVATAQTAARNATPERVAEAAMLKADRDFNKAVADRDMSRFLSLVAEDATFNAEPRAGSGGEGVGALLLSGRSEAFVGADEGRIAGRRRCRLHRRHVGAPDAGA